MLINDLPYEEQLKLTRIAGACLALKDRLERHAFKVMRFQVIVAADMINFNDVIYLYGIETRITMKDTLPAGTINVAALVQ